MSDIITNIGQHQAPQQRTLTVAQGYALSLQLIHHLGIAHACSPGEVRNVVLEVPWGPFCISRIDISGRAVEAFVRSSPGLDINAPLIPGLYDYGLDKICDWMNERYMEWLLARGTSVEKTLWT